MTDMGGQEELGREELQHAPGGPRDANDHRRGALCILMLTRWLCEGTPESLLDPAGGIDPVQARVSKSRRKSVSGGLQTWRILKNSGPDALETPLSSLKLG